MTTLLENVADRVAKIESRYNAEFLGGGTETQVAQRWRAAGNADPQGLPICQTLEFHAAHGCNLGCDHCSHFSNYLDGQSVPAHEAEAAFSTWQDKMFVPKVKILGGEPLLNPELGEILIAARRSWPQARMMLHTNGMLLAKHPRLPDILAEHGIHLFLSWHSQEPTYLQAFERILDMVAQWNVTYTVAPSILQWRGITNGVGSAMRPWQSEPRTAWENCRARYAVQLHAGRLWKCPPLAYLPLALQEYGLENSPEWQPYLNYQSLSPDCTADELRSFLQREEEPTCSMCSSMTVMVEKDIRKRHVP